MRQAIEALGTMLGVVAFGLGWAELEGGPGEPDPKASAGPAAVEAEGRDGYPDPMDHRLRPVAEPREWLVDGFNLLHAVLLGGRDREEWWTEARRAEVLELAAGFDSGEAPVWVVFDGPEERCGEQPGPEGVRAVFAPSADEWLLARVRESGDPSRLAVVTADRALVGRLERCGARVLPPTRFAELCRGPLPGG